MFYVDSKIKTSHFEQKRCSFHKRRKAVYKDDKN